MSMNSRNTQEELETWFRLFEPYEHQLRDFEGRDGEYGARFALLFRQALRLLLEEGELTEIMPRTFIEVARRYFDRDKETVRHFSYGDNRHFFLSDLLDWLKIYERGQQMRRMGRE